LLRILAGRKDALAGEVLLGHGAICAFYDQDTSSLREDSTPFLEIRREKPSMNDQEVRNHLARFLFRGGEVDKEMPALSGGERARLCLARLVLSEPSWLALDEPTNHLDLAGRTALEEMLGDFDGALICVSHDREFLDGLCNHIFEVSDGTVRSFEGNYSHWRRVIEAERVAAQVEVAKTPPRPSQGKATKPAPEKKSSSGKGKGKGKVRNPWAFEKLEKRIIALEERLGALNEAIATEAVYRDPQKLRENQFEIAEVEDELSRANEEWAGWE
jgi:ATP-binding cassette subfamily F protein 3